MHPAIGISPDSFNATQAQGNTRRSEFNLLELLTDLDDTSPQGAASKLKVDANKFSLYTNPESIRKFYYLTLQNFFSEHYPEALHCLSRCVAKITTIEQGEHLLRCISERFHISIDELHSRYSYIVTPIHIIDLPDRDEVENLLHRGSELLESVPAASKSTEVLYSSTIHGSFDQEGSLTRFQERKVFFRHLFESALGRAGMSWTPHLTRELESPLWRGRELFLLNQIIHQNRFFPQLLQPRDENSHTRRQLHASTQGIKTHEDQQERECAAWLQNILKCMQSQKDFSQYGDSKTSSENQIIIRVQFSSIGKAVFFRSDQYLWQLFKEVALQLHSRQSLAKAWQDTLKRKNPQVASQCDIRVSHQSGFTIQLSLALIATLCHAWSQMYSHSIDIYQCEGDACTYIESMDASLFWSRWKL